MVENRRVGLWVFGAVCAVLAILLGGRSFATPGGATPGRATPGRATPGRATPGRATPGRVTPGGATPGRAMPGEVLLYGDSLAWESASFFTLQLAGRAPVSTATFPMTALCDYIDRVEAEALHARPAAVVLEFSGNLATPCTAGLTLETAAARYAAEAESLTAFLRGHGITVFWVTAPRGRPPGPGSPLRHDQFDAPEPFTTAIYRDLVTRWRAQGQDVWLIDAARALLHADGSWAARLPCLSVDRGCVRGTTRVRAPDGAHFCPSGPAGEGGACPVWSGGAWRFASAMSIAVRERFGLTGDGPSPPGSRHLELGARRRHPPHVR